MTKKELDNKVKELSDHFKTGRKISPNIKEIMNFFKDKYNTKIFSKGRLCWIDLDFFFNNSENKKEWRKRFDNNPIQPIKITYKRKDVIFFKWLNYPKYKEEWFVEDKSSLNIWPKIIYPQEIRYSELFYKKIKKLKKKDPEELYIQVNLLELDNFNGLINIEKDVKYEDIF